MPATHRTSSPAIESSRSHREAGFSLIEIMVVLMVVLVLVGLALMSGRGAKKAATFRLAQAAATTYAEAIEAYMADNGQVPPAMTGVAWPATPRDVRIGGPRDLMLKASDGSPKRYMPRAAPEAVSDGVVDLVPNGGAPIPGARAVISYSVVGSSYQLRVRTLPAPGEATMQCVVTNAPALPQGYARCS